MGQGKLVKVKGQVYSNYQIILLDSNLLKLAKRTTQIQGPN